MQEKCPVCGSNSVKVIDIEKRVYKCFSCDETFIFDDAPQKEYKERSSEKTGLFSPKEIYAQNISSIVEVICLKDDEDSFGTGFFISENGYLVTNFHVLVFKKEGTPALCDSVSICKSRSDEFLEADIVYLDAENDLALLKAEGNFNPVSLAFENVEIGDKVFAVGNSRGDGLNLLDGLVGDTDRPFKAAKTFLFNALVTHGCSGGPVFNERGEVCGVTVGGSADTAGMNFAIPISTVIDFIQEAKANKQLDINI